MAETEADLFQKRHRCGKLLITFLRETNDQIGTDRNALNPGADFFNTLQKLLGRIRTAHAFKRCITACLQRNVQMPGNLRLFFHQFQ